MLNLANLIKKYGGLWIAYKPETQRIVSSGKKAKSVYSLAQKKGVSAPTLFKVPTKYVPYIG